MAKGCREGKKMLTIELDDNIYEALKCVSLEYGVGISTASRMILLDYLKKYTNYLRKEESN